MVTELKGSVVMIKREWVRSSPIQVRFRNKVRIWGIGSSRLKARRSWSDLVMMLQGSCLLGVEGVVKIATEYVLVSERG